MTVSAETDRNVIQALAQVARLAEYTLASVTTSDDAQKRVLTIKFSGVSGGFVQDYLPYDADTTPLIAHVNGRREVEKIEGMSPAEIDATLQPGDLAETEEEANAEIEAAAGQIEGIIPEPVALVPGETPEPEAIDPDEQLRDKATPLVGELAAAAKQNRRR